jgi:hypothetical protein
MSREGQSPLTLTLSPSPGGEGISRSRPADFEDLVAQIQRTRKGVQYYVPAARGA